MKIVTVIFILLGLAVLALAALRTYNTIQYNKRRRRRRVNRDANTLTAAMYLAAVALFLLAILAASWGANSPDSDKESTASTTEETTPPVLFTPEKTASSDPSQWGILWDIFENGKTVSEYSRTDPISFGDPEEYFALPGISAFRGNNYRNNATYGTASVTDKTVSTAWTVQTGTLSGSTWSGSGWTGQPLIVQWDAETRSLMNLYENKKNKTDLVEVIYATLDGHIYFLDLEDGSYTRDPINVGMCFKGAGSLDPRGYPLLYVGSGDENSSGQRPRMFIISLIDGSILYEYGHEDSLAYREDHDRWCAFDSSPLVDEETDNLIWPGENGLLYTIHLNTNYDKTAGTISVSPDTPVLTRYDTTRSNNENYWYGYEASANIVENYLYVSENGGMFYCVDLNTMELVWAQDTKDDSNSSPVFERVSEEQGYVYTAPSLHWTKDANSQGSISIYKLDALTGEIVWEVPYQVHTIEGVSGGIQSSPLLGKAGSSIDGLIIYTISRIPSEYSGIMVALDAETGNEVWRLSMDHYAWSSPVAFYSEDGTAYVAVADSGGDLTLVDGATGTVLDKLTLGGVIEASPAVFGNQLVVGTRSEQICCVKIN